MSQPKCYSCAFRRTIPGDAHSACANTTAKVEGEDHGKVLGWFYWPINFDPVWLKSCNGFKQKE